MKKHIMIFVHTGYHLLLAVNQILSLYKDQSKYYIDLYIKVSHRLGMPLDFSHLPVTVNYFDINISINRNLNEEERVAIESLKNKNPDIFIFFQEYDTLMLILSSEYAKRDIDVYLYEDGLKPYSNRRFHSIELLENIHKENLWMKRNGFRVPSWAAPIFSKKYAFRKGITKLYLTHPEAYKNWNNKDVEKIDFLPIETLNPSLKRLFKWDDAILPESEHVIFYMNQPMRADNGNAELELFSKLVLHFPSNSIYIKLHPNTFKDKSKLDLYKGIEKASERVKIIESVLPAELFTMNMRRSIILSLYSTGMFLNNPENKYYYLYRLFYHDFKALRRIQLKKVPAPHITSVNSLAEIHF